MINLDSKETKKNDYEKAGKIIRTAKSAAGAVAAAAAVAGVALKFIPRIKGAVKK